MALFPVMLMLIFFVIFVTNMRAICEVVIMTMMNGKRCQTGMKMARTMMKGVVDCTGVRRRIISEEAYASSNKTECHVPVFCNISQQGCIIVLIISFII